MKYVGTWQMIIFITAQHRVIRAEHFSEGVCIVTPLMFAFGIKLVQSQNKPGHIANTVDFKNVKGLE